MKKGLQNLRSYGMIFSFTKEDVLERLHILILRGGFHDAKDTQVFDADDSNFLDSFWKPSPGREMV